MIPHPSTSLYVGDLSPEVSESHLLEVFKQAGPLASIRVCRDTITRRSLGYAYVNYNNSSDAEKALDSLNGVLIKGKPCRVMWVQRDPSLRKSGLGNIFIKNLDKSIDHKQLYDTFSLFGKILSCKVALDSKNESKGFGFVHFEKKEDAEQAIKQVNAKELVGKIVYVAPFIPRKSRSATGSSDTFTNVYFKTFPDSWDEDKIVKIFNKFGPIKNVHLARDDAKVKGFGFVNFEEHESAVAAVKALHNRLWEDFNEDGSLKERTEEPVEEKAEKPAETEVKKEEEKKEDEKKEDEKKEDEKKEDASADKPAEETTEKKEEKEDDDIAKPADTDAGKTEEAPKKEEGKRFYCARFQKKTERMRTYKEKWRVTNLYIKNIDESVDEKRLEEAFAPYGVISSAKIMTDEKGDSKGFGFVCFSTPEEAERAVAEMNGRMIGSKPLYVALAQRKEERKLHLEMSHSRKPRGMPGAMYGAPNMFYGGNVPPQYFSLAARRPPAGWPAPPAYGYMPVRGGPGRGVVPGGPMPGAGRRGPATGPVPTPAPAMAPAPAPAAVTAPGAGGEKLTMAQLSRFPPDAQTQILGERLYPLIHASQPDRAGKITGMLLERYKNELPALLTLLNQPENLEGKVFEAVAVLDKHYDQAADA